VNEKVPDAPVDVNVAIVIVPPVTTQLALPAVSVPDVIGNVPCPLALTATAMMRGEEALSVPLMEMTPPTGAGALTVVAYIQAAFHGSPSMRAVIEPAL
jgi:hypothetical protein